MNQVNTLETLYPIIQTLCADDYNELLKQMNLNQKTINDAADALHKIIFRQRQVQKKERFSSRFMINNRILNQNSFQKEG